MRKPTPKIESGPPAVLRYEKLRWLGVVLKISYEQNEVSLIIVGFVVVVQALHKAKKREKTASAKARQLCKDTLIVSRLFTKKTEKK